MAGERENPLLLDEAFVRGPEPPEYNKTLRRLWRIANGLPVSPARPPCIPGTRRVLAPRKRGRKPRVPAGWEHPVERPPAWMTLDAVGAELGCTRENVRQLEARALKVVRWRLHNALRGEQRADGFFSRDCSNAYVTDPAVRDVLFQPGTIDLADEEESPSRLDREGLIILAAARRRVLRDPRSIRLRRESARLRG